MREGALFQMARQWAAHDGLPTSSSVANAVGGSYAKPVFPVNIAADPDVRIGVWTRVGIYTEDSVYRDQTALEHELVEMFNKREVSNASSG